MKKTTHSLYRLLLTALMLLMLVSSYNITVFASADNSLSKLEIKGIKLDPEFKYSRLKYTAHVSNEITQVDVEAITSNKGAKILSISGNKDLQVGENTVNIVVQAPNGQKVTYSILLIRSESGNVDQSISTDSEETTDKKKTKTEKLKERIRKKNKEIEELNSTISSLNTSIQELETKNKSLLDENQKIYSQRIFMIIINVLLLFSLIIAMFIGVIKKTTSGYLNREFPFGQVQSEIEIKKPKLKTEERRNRSESEHEDYAVMSRAPKIRHEDDLLSNIETVIANELRSNQKDGLEDLEHESENIDVNKAEALDVSRSKSADMITEKEGGVEQDLVSSSPVKEEKDNFSFDIIEI